jgi:hypothetical protein
MDDKKNDKGPPKISMNPYIFTALLFLFGVWCLYDGWFTSDPDMHEHRLFNQVLSVILLPWSVYDFFKVKKKYRANSNDSSADKE